jgi:hypothetical protein
MAFKPALTGQPSLRRRLFGTGERSLTLLRAAWPSAVGAELSRRTEVVALEGSTLWVRVPDAGWRRVLHRMRGTIRQRLRRVAGELAPARLAFIEGPVTAPPEPDAPTPAPIAVAPASVRRSASQISDPELRELFLATSAKYLMRRRNHPSGETAEETKNE